MKVKPMIGEYEVPGIQRIGTVESRDLVEIVVPGLEGSLHHDLGSAAVSVVLHGTLAGDDPRDAFLESIRAAFSAGEPVDFVADILTATSVEQVLIADLDVSEAAGSADSFRYTIQLIQHVEPPAPPDLSSLEASLDAEAASLFDALQVPDLLAAIPEIGDPTPPLAGVLNGVTAALGPVADAGSVLTDLFGD